MGTDGNPKDLLSPMMCVAIWATTHEIKHCVGGKILDDCPLVEIGKVGKWIKSEIGGAKVCSICQSHMGLSNFKYCPNCGAEMRGSDND